MGITKDQIERIVAVHLHAYDGATRWDGAGVAELKQLALLGLAVHDMLESFGWTHATVRAEVESDRLAETVEGCLFVAIERAIRPADFQPSKPSE